MHRGQEAQLAQSEHFARKINESMDEERAGDGGAGPRWFVCECAATDCAELVDVGAEKYRQIHANPKHFIVLRGHEEAAIETVVEVHASYVVVEKTGEAGRVAE